MSTLTQVGGIAPAVLGQGAALALAVTLDLTLGDLPGRAAVQLGIGRWIALVHERVDRLTSQLGGGRGSDLAGGILRTILVVGVPTGLVWILVDRADAVGGPVALVVRTVVIAAGLSVRTTADALLEAISAPDPITARGWLSTAAGRPVGHLGPTETGEATVRLTSELIVGAIVAPLFWLAAGGPAGFWAFLFLRRLALRSGDHPWARGETAFRWRGLAGRVPQVGTEAAEGLPTLLGVALTTVVAAGMRLHAPEAVRSVLEVARARRPLMIWCQAALAGALGSQIRGGWLSATKSLDGRSLPLVGPAGGTQPDGPTAALGVRVLQVVALLAAGLCLLTVLIVG